MFAVIKTGGKQYSVESGKTLKIEKVEGKKGDSLSFNQVILISNTNEQIFGNPLIKGAEVQATIVNQIRDKKITVFKKKRRKDYRRKYGHRQYLTVIKINKIINSNSKETEKSKTTQVKKQKKTDKPVVKTSKSVKSSVKSSKSVKKNVNKKKKETKGK